MRVGGRFSVKCSAQGKYFIEALRANVKCLWMIFVLLRLIGYVVHIGYWVGVCVCACVCVQPGARARSGQGEQLTEREVEFVYATGRQVHLPSVG